MANQTSESIIIPEVATAQITPTSLSEAYASIETSPTVSEINQTLVTRNESDITPKTENFKTENPKTESPKTDVLQEILKSNANFQSKVNLEEEEDEEEVAKLALAQYSLPQKSKINKKYSHKSSSDSSDTSEACVSTDFDSKDFIPRKLKLKRAAEIIPDIGFSSGNTSKTFDDVREMIAYYNKYKETFHNYNTQKINRILQCEGYKFSKIGGNFNIVSTDGSASKPRETWKNKSIELEKIMQTIQHNNERLRNDVEMLTSKLVKAYSKISSQSRDIENLTKVVTNMYETQIPALTNKINKLKLANEYYKRQ